VDGDNNGTATVDRGAYEFAPQVNLSLTDGSSSGLDFAASVTPGTNDNPVGLFALSASGTGATFDGVTVTNSAPGVAGISAARLYWSTDQTLDGSDAQLGSDVTVNASNAPSTLGFSGFSQSIPTADRFVILAIDVQNGADDTDVQFSLAQTSDLQTSGGQLAEVNGQSQTTFSNLPLANGTVTLPVELVAFEALSDGAGAVRLHWTTASETNNAGFEVQHLAGGDGAHASAEDGQATAWQRLGWVDGHGTTAEAQRYTYRTDDLVPGTHRFRLKQIDYDGAFEYSPEVEVIVGLHRSHVVERAYPNPFNPEATLRFAVQREQPVTVSLYDALGRQVAVPFDGVARAGQMQRVTIDGSALPSGLYLVRVRGERFVETRTLTLVR
jgi:hypothetical protein